MCIFAFVNLHGHKWFLIILSKRNISCYWALLLHSCVCIYNVAPFAVVSIMCDVGWQWMKRVLVMDVYCVTRHVGTGARTRRWCWLHDEASETRQTWCSQQRHSQGQHQRPDDSLLESAWCVLTVHSLLCDLRRKRDFIESSQLIHVLCGTVCSLFFVALHRWTQAIHRTHTERVSDSSRPMSKVHIPYTNSCVCMFALKLPTSGQNSFSTCYILVSRVRNCCVARPEQQRRNDVNRCKLYFKVLFNNKEVSRTPSR